LNFLLKYIAILPDQIFTLQVWVNMLSYSIIQHIWVPLLALKWPLILKHIHLFLKWEGLEQSETYLEPVRRPMEAD